MYRRHAAGAWHLYNSGTPRKSCSHSFMGISVASFQHTFQSPLSQDQVIPNNWKHQNRRPEWIQQPWLKEICGIYRPKLPPRKNTLQYIGDAPNHSSSVHLSSPSAPGNSTHVRPRFGRSWPGTSTIKVLHQGYFDEGYDDPLSQGRSLTAASVCSLDFQARTK